MKIGDIVREYRIKNGLSQRQFANISGISNGYISMIEDGKNPKTGETLTPSLVILKKIATAMRMSLNDFMAQIDDVEVSLKESAENIAPVGTQRIPIPGSIACGKPAPSTETQKNSPTEPMLDEGEKSLLDLFREVPEDKQQLVLDMIRVALSKKE